MNEQWTVALDADGVLVDFEGHVCAINKVPREHFSKIPRGRMWRSVEAYDRDVGPFFERAGKMPDADILLDYVRANFINHFILTACGNTPKNAATQKRNYFRREYGPQLIVKTVQNSAQKAQFAGPKVILVDDRLKSIDPWVEAGGIGILHTSAADTIRQLQAIVAGTREPA